MNATLPLLAGAGILTFLALRSADRSAKNVTIQPVSGSFTGITIKELTGNIIFKVINPEPLPLPIVAIFGKLNVSNNFIGTLVNFDKISIPGRSTRELKVSFSLPIFSVASSILDIITDAKDGKLPVGLEGYIDTTYGRVILNSEIEFKIPFV